MVAPEVYAEIVPQTAVCAEILPRKNPVGPPPWVVLGPLTRVISAGAKWISQDAFPAWQVWADELERLLAFLVAQGQFGRFLPRLRDDRRARNAALAEVRVAFFMYRNGFRIEEWEPLSGNGRRGEFAVSWCGGPAIFTEVKAPDWEGELFPQEKTGPRKAQGKHVDLEARYVDPLEQPFAVVTRNAVPKLTPDRPNLIVIADDLFVSPASVPYLDARIERYLGRPENACIGAIMFFNAEPWQDEIEYTLRFDENPAAVPPCRLPTQVVSGLIASAQASRDRRRRRYSP